MASCSNSCALIYVCNCVEWLCYSPTSPFITLRRQKLCPQQRSDYNSPRKMPLTPGELYPGHPAISHIAGQPSNHRAIDLLLTVVTVKTFLSNYQSSYTLPCFKQTLESWWVVPYLCLFSCYRVCWCLHEENCRPVTSRIYKSFASLCHLIQIYVIFDITHSK